MKFLYFSVVLLASTTASLNAQTYTWDGNGNSNTSGTWSTATNWNPDTVPGAGNTAILPDVTTGTRTITYDTNAPGSLGTLNITQATMGSINQLDIQRSVLTITNALTLGSTGGTAELSLSPSSTSSVVLTASGGITAGTGGLLLLNGFSNGFVGNLIGNVTLSGGTMEIGAALTANGTSAVQNIITGTLTMSSGTVQFDNGGTGVVADRRLDITGNVNITGGTVTQTGSGGTLTMSGATNVLNATAFPTGLGVTLDNGTQTLSTSLNLAAGILVRGSGTKTITRTGGTSIGIIQFLDGSNSATAGPTFQLGSDITLNSGAGQPFTVNFSQVIDANGAIQLGIDANGHTLDLSAGAGSGVYTPNASGQAGVTNTAYTFSSTAAGGTITANAFNFSTAAVTTNVGAGLTLRAIGGAGTATTLSGTGTISAASTFIYSGAATAGLTAGGTSTASEASLTSTRTIGMLTVTAGALNVTQSLTTGGTVSVNGAGTLDLGGTSYVTLTLAAGNFVASGSTLELSLGGSNDVITAAGTGQSFSLSSVTIAINQTPSAGTYMVFNGFTGTNTVNNVMFTGVPTGLTATLGTNGVITFAAAVPEPGTWALMITGAGILGFGVVRSRRNAPVV